MKWRLRCFLAEDETFLFNFILDLDQSNLEGKSLSQFGLSCSARKRSARSCGESFCNDSGTTGQQNILSFKAILTKILVLTNFYVPLFTKVRPEKAECRHNNRYFHLF